MRSGNLSDSMEKDSETESLFLCFFQSGKKSGTAFISC